MRKLLLSPFSWLILVFIASLPIVIIRINHEIKENTVEICTEFESLEKICRKKGYQIKHLLPKLRAFGISSISVRGLIDEKMELIAKNNFHIVIKIADVDEIQNIPKHLLQKVSAIILERFNPSELKEFLSYLNETNRKILFFELEDDYERNKSLFRRYPNRIIRGHRLSGRRFSPKLSLKRYLRAIKERKCRFIYLDIPFEDIKSSLKFLKELSSEVKKKYKLGIVSPKEFPKFMPPSLGQYTAIMIAIFFPLFSIFYYKNMRRRIGIYETIKLFLLISFINSIGGVVATTLLSSQEYLLKIREIRGVSFAFFLPLVMSVFILSKPPRIKKFLSKSLENLNLAIALSISVIVILVGLRMKIFFILPFEIEIRSLLENVLPVRPRFKEFLIGHPLLLIGIYFNFPTLVLLGMIGQVSLINTFLHLHTPFLISFYRAMIGIAIGILLGIIGIFFSKWFLKIDEKSADLWIFRI